MYTVDIKRMISRKLNISRAGIWKHIEDLRRQGYDIEAAPSREVIHVTGHDFNVGQLALGGLGLDELTLAMGI